MNRNWMEKAVKKPGALRATAERKGLVKGDEKLSKTDLNKLASSPNAKTRARANLAKTFAKERGK